MTNVGFNVLAAGTLALAASAGFAQTGRPAPAPPSIPRTEFIKTMDAEFAKRDANKDGQLTRAEVEAYQRIEAQAAAAQRARNAFAALDTDKNGQLSFAEFSKLVTATPQQANGQGVISSMDSNKDGKVSQIEYRAATLINFDRMDADKDGVVTPAEMKAAGLIK